MENLVDVGNSTTGFDFITKHFDFGDTDIGVENPCLEIDDFFCFEYFLQSAHERNFYSCCSESFAKCWIWIRLHAYLPI